MDDPIKVLLADDDGLFLASLRALIDRQPELAVVASARRKSERTDCLARFARSSGVERMLATGGTGGTLTMTSSHAPGS